MNYEDIFLTPKNVSHKQYEALRAFFLEGKSAKEVSKQFGYTQDSLYSLVKNFKRSMDPYDPVGNFFQPSQMGRKPMDQNGEIKNEVIILRKHYLSVPDIKSILDAKNIHVSEKYIFNILKNEGFARLPRRDKLEKIDTIANMPLTAPKVKLLDSNSSEKFNTNNAGLLCLIPYIASFGIDKLIKSSSYPGTKTIPTLNSILCFLALKLSNIRRYSADDLWCMDRGMGIFAGLNVLPKTAWFTSYSHRVTRKMNLEFLRSLNKLWRKRHLLSDTANLDFVAVPYWGEDNEHLEKNWSGTRRHALTSILAAIANDPDSGIITYGDATVRHKRESGVVVEFLDFYKKSKGEKCKDIKYLIFDSKLTTYKNLRKLEDNNVKFITIRRRGKKIVEELKAIPKSSWKTVKVQASNTKTRELKVIERTIFIEEYGKELREIAIMEGHNKEKPALIITNDNDLILEKVIRKYSQRWLVEKEISEQTHFFHLNKVSSSMVIKVDFDLTMTILAHNIYRLLAIDLTDHSNLECQKLYEKFINNSGYVEVEKKKVSILLKKKRNLPGILTAMDQFQNLKPSWLNKRLLEIKGATTS